LTDITEKFHLSLKGQGYTTLGGLVFGILGHEPRVGDAVEISGFILEVQEIEGQRIKHIKLKKNK
jgi:CBS domain containing-hemolysin-like protein